MSLEQIKLTMETNWWKQIKEMIELRQAKIVDLFVKQVETSLEDVKLFKKEYTTLGWFLENAENLTEKLERKLKMDKAMERNKAKESKV